MSFRDTKIKIKQNLAICDFFGQAWALQTVHACLPGHWTLDAKGSDIFTSFFAAPCGNVVKLTFLPASSCDDMRSSSSRCCCVRSLSDSVRRSWSSSSCRVRLSNLVSFSRLSLSRPSFSTASLPITIIQYYNVERPQDNNCCLLQSSY